MTQQDITERLAAMVEDGSIETLIVASGTGRGPTGRLRNFKAMSDAKLTSVADAVIDEADDAEAIEAITAELKARGY